MIQVVIAEDDQALADLMSMLLTAAGYMVLLARTGAEVLDLARLHQPGLVVLEVVLPELDGFSTCRLLRAESAVPIMLLASRDDATDHIAGLELGADDYLVKPLHAGVFLARVHALMRRGQHKPQREPREVLHRGPIVVDIGARRVWWNEKEVELQRKEFDLLVCLMRHNGETVSIDFLRQELFGRRGTVRSVIGCVHHVRTKIERDAARPDYLLTVRGFGYRLTVPSDDPT